MKTTPQLQQQHCYGSIEVIAKKNKIAPRQLHSYTTLAIEQEENTIASTTKTLRKVAWQLARLTAFGVIIAMLIYCSGGSQSRHRGGTGVLLLGNDRFSEMSMFEEEEGGINNLAPPLDLGMDETTPSFVDDYLDDQKPYYYKEQLVDHFLEVDHHTVIDDAFTWSHKYYISSKYFHGPGHPIMFVLGGESPMTGGMYYPYITEHLAKKINAFVVQAEHRFYGKNHPLKDKKKTPTNKDLARLMTPKQAIADFIQLAKHIRAGQNCSEDRYSRDYCPIITVGASYPGFLSAMMRLVHPDIVDISYAASAPLLLYSQSVDKRAYFDHVTNVAEKASPGCALAVKKSLLEFVKVLQRKGERQHDEEDGDSGSRRVVLIKDVASTLDVCVDTIPDYIQKMNIFSREILAIIGATFADYNMGHYPPTGDTQLSKSCKIFQNESLTSIEKVRMFLVNIVPDGGEEDDSDNNEELYLAKTNFRREQHEAQQSPACFDMRTQLPAGPNGTIFSADWSGGGGGKTGEMWEFQTCSYLIIAAGFSEESMFPSREWTMEWLNKHCKRRFQIIPKPTSMVKEWGFDDLVGKGASRILFTNGMNDMWSVGSILEDLSDSLVVLNFVNGAHHSELNSKGPTDDDTEDIKEGHIRIADTIEKWLKEL